MGTEINFFVTGDFNWAVLTDGCYCREINNHVRTIFLNTVDKGNPTLEVALLD